MIIPQIIQEIDNDLERFSILGFLARWRHRLVIKELRILRRYILQFKDKEVLEKDIQEPSEPDERNLMASHAVKQINICQKFISEITRYYSKDGEVIPQYIGGLITQCNQDMEKEPFEYQVQRVELFKKKLDDFSKRLLID